MMGKDMDKLQTLIEQLNKLVEEQKKEEQENTINNTINTTIGVSLFSLNMLLLFSFGNIFPLQDHL